MIVYILILYFKEYFDQYKLLNINLLLISIINNKTIKYILVIFKVIDRINKYKYI